MGDSVGVDRCVDPIQNNKSFNNGRTRRSAPTILLLLGFFFLDILKPFGRELSAEFLLLGVIFISLNKNISKPVILSILFGGLKDIFALSPKPLYLIELPLICVTVSYLFSRFTLARAQAPASGERPLAGLNIKKFYALTGKSLIILIALIIHIIFNSAYSWIFLPFFYLKFLVHSFIIYYFMNYLLSKYAKV